MTRSGHRDRGASDDAAALQRVVELARRLPIPPDRGDIEEQRAHLLASTARIARRRRKAPLVVAAIAPLLAAAAVLALPRIRSGDDPLGLPAPLPAAPPAPAPAPAPAPVPAPLAMPSEPAHPAPATVGPARRSMIVGSSHASYEIASTQPDEVVRLRDGALRIEVTPLGPGERFRVVTGDAEVEVRGTSFEVVVAADRLTTVLVYTGRVAIRHGERATAELAAGEHWRAPAPAAAAAAATATATARPAPRRPASPALEEPFQRGITALRAGDPALAIAELQRVTSDPSGPLTEDARFWLAVAHARANQRSAAVAALDAFLSLHPASPRCGEASTMLGWLLLEAGELDLAERRFERGLTDVSAPVRRSARAGFDAVAARRRGR